MCTLGLLAPGPEPLRFAFPNPPQPLQISPFFSFFSPFFFFSFEFGAIHIKAKVEVCELGGREGPPPQASPLLLAGTWVTLIRGGRKQQPKRVRDWRDGL